MQLEALSCNNCGAPVDVPQSANFITCAHCGSRLAVKRTETAHYTEVLDRLQAHAYKVDRDLQYLRVQNDLLLLDQAWEEESKQYMVRTKGGAPVEPSLGQVITLIIVAGIAILVGIALVCPLINSIRSAVPFNNNNTGLFFSCVTIMIILMIAATLSGAISAYTKYGTYKSAKASYIARRNALVSYLNQNHGYSSMPGPGS
jgi:DNA-directed RNA polymerase subunit RPC12/RpoP